jgi:hypothetical protein
MTTTKNIPNSEKKKLLRSLTLAEGGAAYPISDQHRAGAEILRQERCDDHRRLRRQIGGGIRPRNLVDDRRLHSAGIARCQGLRGQDAGQARHHMVEESSPSAGRATAASGGRGKTMPTNRIPLRDARRARLVITDEMLDIYKRMRAIKCSCAPEPHDFDHEECDGCQAWLELNRHPAMQALVPLWEVYVVPPPSGESFLREQEQARRLALEQALAGRRG